MQYIDSLVRFILYNNYSSVPSDPFSLVPIIGDQVLLTSMHLTF